MNKRHHDRVARIMERPSKWKPADVKKPRTIRPRFRDAVLWALKDWRPATITEVCQKIGCARTTASTILKRLTDEGLVSSRMTVFGGEYTRIEQGGTERGVSTVVLSPYFQAALEPEIRGK